MSNADMAHTVTATEVSLKAAMEAHDVLSARLSASRSKPSDKELSELKRLDHQIEAQHAWLAEHGGQASPDAHHEP